MRLFVAINLSDDVRSALWDATEELRRRDFPVRWVSPDLLHVTLKFLGDTEAGRIAGIEAALAEAAAEVRQHSMEIHGLGAFPSLKRPQTIWAGCEQVPAMELLQHGIERRFEALGFPVEGRPFRPHVTIGRVKRGTPRNVLEPLGNELPGVELHAVAMASSVELMESRLGPNGPRYRAVKSCGLGS